MRFDNSLETVTMESQRVQLVLVFALVFLVYAATSTAEEPVLEDIRLVDGSQPYEGRVELLVNGTWGTICDEYWDDLDAQVVCRQLGYDRSQATAYTSAFFQQGNGPVYLTKMNCGGREPSIFECPKSKPFLQTGCSHNRDAGVSCIKPVLEDIRLVDGSQPYEGRVELLVNGTWGTICDDGWDDRDAQVVCRQLGYDPSAATAYASAVFQPGDGPVYLWYMNCGGTERSILECPTSKPFGQTSCSHFRDAGVSCIKPVLEDIRLVDGSQPYEGRVELLVNGTWGTICDVGWGYLDAQVVCRQLGYDPSQATAYKSAFFQQGYGPIYLEHMNCGGTELSILECPTPYPFRLTGCSHNRDAGVSCIKPVLEDIRLVDGSQPYEGRVELLVNGTWGTICARVGYWTVPDAQVVCRQLGYEPSGATAYSSGFFRSGKGPIHLMDMNCGGRERSIFECPKGVPFGQRSCVHFRDAGVSCSKPVLEDIRLVDGSQPYEGRVELLINGTWGTICDAGWDDQDAQVVCRQLGYDRYEATAYTSAFFQPGNGPVYLTNMNCGGTERSIFDCPKSTPFLQTGCLHNKDAGVSCIKPVLEDIRLVDGSQPYEGRVELLVNGKWGTICGNNWDDQDARVVCRQLGYDPLAGATAYRSATFNAGSGPIYLTDLQCGGRETDILKCPKKYPFKQVSCLHRDDAGVACFNIDNCTTNPCGDYGVCINNVNGHTCTCNDGTNGLSCQPPGDSSVPWKAAVGVLALVLTLCAIVAVFCVIRNRRQRDKGQASVQETGDRDPNRFYLTPTHETLPAHSHQGVQQEASPQSPCTTESTYTGSQRTSEGGDLQSFNTSTASCSQSGYETPLQLSAVDEPYYTEMMCDPPPRNESHYTIA